MCITGEAGGFRDHFGVEKKKEKKIGSNVTTFQLRDVSTSGQQKKKVNERANVTTYQRHDVQTSQRRDFIAISASES